MQELRWYDATDENPPWIKALAEVRHLAARASWRYQHVQAIIVAIESVHGSCARQSGVLSESALQYWRAEGGHHALKPRKCFTCLRGSSIWTELLPTMYHAHSAELADDMPS